jgi:hypothetical protein
MMLTPCLILTLLAPAADPPADRHKENFVFKDLTTKGFKVGPETTHKLPAPWMADGLTAKEQTDIITKLSPGVGKPADVLRKGDFKAPMFYKETRIEKADEKAPCYSIDIWFVAYGDLDVMAGDKPEDLFSENPGKSKSKSISDEELKLRNLERKFKEMPLQERWTHTKSVLEKEINVAATTHSIIGLSDESLMVASTLDPSFANDENYPNKWDRKITARQSSEQRWTLDHGLLHEGDQVESAERGSVCGDSRSDLGALRLVQGRHTAAKPFRDVGQERTREVSQ